MKICLILIIILSLSCQYCPYLLTLSKCYQSVLYLICIHKGSSINYSLLTVKKLNDNIIWMKNTYVTLQTRHKALKSIVERILRYISLAYNVLHVERAKMKVSRDRAFWGEVVVSSATFFPLFFLLHDSSILLSKVNKITIQMAHKY